MIIMRGRDSLEGEVPLYRNCGSRYIISCGYSSWLRFFLPLLQLGRSLCRWTASCLTLRVDRLMYGGIKGRRGWGELTGQSSTCLLKIRFVYNGCPTLFKSRSVGL